VSAPVSLLHVANVVARNSIPLLGIAVLGWSPGKLLIVYFADTVASLLALMMLVCDRLFGIDAGGARSMRRISQTIAPAIDRQSRAPDPPRWDARRMAGSSGILPAARKAHIARHRR